MVGSLPLIYRFYTATARKKRSVVFFGPVFALVFAMLLTVEQMKN